MPVITAIEQQSRRERVSIYVDGEYFTSLANRQLQNVALAVGEDVSADRLAWLKRQSETGKAFEKAMGYISYRLRSEAEIKLYLRQKGYAEDVAAECLRMLSTAGAINDERFARLWVEDRRRIRQTSTARLRSELAAKGVSRDAVDTALAGADMQDDVTAIMELVQTRQLERRYEDRQKLIRYLGGKGFSFSDIGTALQRLDDRSVRS